MRTLPAILTAAVLTAAAAPSQVVISEVNLTPQNTSDDHWVELVNLSATPADLSGWSLYYATRTPGLPGSYWWAFPVGTTLQSAGFLRVHWFEPIQSPTSTDIWTGNHHLNFLFGYGGEALQKTGGALGLLSSVSNARMNDPAIYRDWVAWGGSGFPREGLAIANNRWISGQFIPSPVNAESLALDYEKNFEPTLPEAFFPDATATPLAPNSPGALVRNYGAGCDVGSVNTPSIQIPSTPAAGNTAFEIVVTGTNGTTQNQLVMLVFGLQELPGIIIPTPIYTCPLWVDLSNSIIVSQPAAGSGAGETRFPLALTGVVTPVLGSFYVQGMLFLLPPTTTDHAGSAGVEFRIGN